VRGRTRFGAVGDHRQGGVGGELEVVVVQRELADDRVAESFDAARVGAHVVAGPQLAEVVAAGGQLADERGQRAVEGAGDGAEVGLFGGVELQRAGDGLQDAVGGVAERAALQPDVVVDAQPGQGGDLLAAQPRHPPLAPGHRQPDRLGADPRPAGGQKLRDLGPLVHVFQDMPR
jgi:hypothetical protein